MLAVEGTDLGRQIALGLALSSALFHAIFGALQKGRFDPWLTRGAIDFCYGVMALLPAIFLVPFPTSDIWLLLGIAWAIHVIYKLLLAMAYERAAFTVVYPVVRGVGPLVTVAFAGVVFSESFTVFQWAGVLLLSGAIFALAMYNLRHVTVGRDALSTAILFAGLTGVAVATYTTFDAYGIRATENPFTFLIWFFVVDAWVFPIIAWRRYQRIDDKPDVVPLMLRGLTGGILAFLSFGAVMMATRLDKVGEAAVLRETSVVFAALIGWFVLKEKVGPRRLAMMVLIAIGAIMVEVGA